MPRDGAPERKDERGQDRHSADNAQQHALGHYDADIAPQCQAHGAHCEEACDGGERTCQNGGERLLHGAHHCLVLIRAGTLFFLEPVQQKDGEIHRHAQLEHRGQSLGDVADLPQKDIGAKVVDNGEYHAQHEDEGYNRFFHAEEQHHQTRPHGTQDVDGHFLVYQGFCVLQNGGHSADEAVLAQDILDGALRLHGHGMGAWVFELDQQQCGTVFAVKEFLDVGRQHFLWRSYVQDVARPQHAFYTRNSLQLTLEGKCVRGGHILHGDHGGGGHVEIVLQISFAHHGIQLRRQIGEDIVIDIGACGTEHGWDQQQHGGRQHRFAVPHHPARKMFHCSTLPLNFCGS